MVDTNFSVNAAGNLTQYNLVKNTEETKDAITADDIKVMIKLGQFNKVRSLIKELENSSPDDKASAQKIAAFAEFYKKEINSDLVFENATSGRGNDVIISAKLYESLVEEHLAKGDAAIDIEQYNVSDSHYRLDDKYINDVLNNEATGYYYGFKDSVVNSRTITTADLRALLDSGEQEKIYSLIQFLEQSNFSDFVNREGTNAPQRIRDYVISYARFQEHDRQFKKNPDWVNPKELLAWRGRSEFDIHDPIKNLFEIPVAELPASGQAEELAKFFESKGDTETAAKIREEIKKVSDERNGQLAKLKQWYEVMGQGQGTKNVSKLQPIILFNNEQAKAILKLSESWKALDEDLQTRILDLIEKRAGIGKQTAE
ncbi:hypothetical protein NO1_0840 [Candidatus Termititenax aidoneus]|uniref:Uncharacterized protein n=1 Tax=Termititenax aidoneus TaxID=2218524 RepID=A0A388TB92_TERA1|nr:hypothetical protein NO1_0840 [Candidatus Termititenax aidoneus]